MQQLKLGFKLTLNWNKYHSKTEPLNARNLYFGFLIDPSFQRVNRPFVLPFNTLDNRTEHSIYYLPTAKVEDYSVMIKRKNFLDQPIKNYIKTYENIRKISTGQVMITIIWCSFKSIQQINFSKSLDVDNNRLISFIIEEVKETILDFSHRIFESIVNVVVRLSSPS